MDTRTYEGTTTAEKVMMHGVSWGAIFAGVFVAISVATILNLLGLGLDLIAIGAHKHNLSHITALSVIWVISTSIIAMLAGGWVAGRMCGPALSKEGALHGIVMCGVSIFATFMLTTTVGSMIGVMSTVVGQSFAATQHAQIAKMNQYSPDQQSMQTMDMSTLSAQNQQQFFNGVQDYFGASTPEEEATARSNMSSFLMQNKGMTEAQVNQVLDSWHQAKQNAIMQADKAVQGLGILVLLFFASVLLSTIASALGGAWGARK